MTIEVREDSKVHFIVNKKTSNLDYEYNVIADLIQLLAINNVLVELVMEEG